VLKAFRWTAAGVLSLTTAAVVAFVVLATSTNIIQEHLRRIILEEAGKRIHGTLAIERIELRYVPLRIEAIGVSLDHLTEGRVLEAESVEVSVDLLSLLTDEIHVQEVAVSRPVVDLVVLEGEVKNLPAIEPGEGGRDVFLESLDVSNGLVRVRALETAPWPVEATLGNVEIDLTAERNAHFEVRVRAGSGEVAAGDVSRTLDSLASRASVDLVDGGVAVRLKRFDLGMLDVALSLEDGQMAVSRDRELTAEMEFAASIPLVVVSSLAHRMPALEGTASCQGRLGFGATGHQVDATCSGRDVAVGGRIVGDVDAVVTLDPRTLALNNASVRQSAGEARFDASLALDTGTYDLDVAAGLGRVHLAELLANMGLEQGPVDLTLSGPARISGTLDPLDLDGEIDLAVRGLEVSVKGPRKKAPVLVPSRSIDLRSTIAVTAEEVRFQGARASVGSTLIRSSGVIGYDGTLDVLVSSPSFDTQDIVRLPGEGLRAAGRLQGHVTGTFDDPRITATAKLGKLQTARVELGKVEGKVRARPRKKLIELLDVTGSFGKSAYRLPACKVLLRSRQKGGVLVEGELIAEDIHVPDLRRMLHLEQDAFRDAEGVIAGRIDFSVEPQRGPEEMMIDVSAAVHGLALAGQPLGTGRVDGRWDRGSLEVRQVDLEGDIGRLVLIGTSVSGGGLDLRIKLSGLDSHRIKRFDLTGMGLEFIADMDLHVIGTASSPEVKGGVLVVSSLAYRGQPLGDVVVGISHRDDVLDLDGLLAGGLLSMKISTKTHGRFDTTVDVGFHDLVLDKQALHLESLSSARGTFTGTVTGKVLLVGGLEAKGRIRLEKAELGLPGYTVKNKGVVKMAFTHEKLTLELVKLGGEGTLVDVSGLVKKSGLDIKLTGKVNLELLGRFSEKVREARGILTPSLALRGTWKEFAVNGKLALTCERLEVAGLPFAVTQTSGTALFTDTGLVLDAAGLVGSGDFTAAGRVPMKGFRPRGYSLRFDFNDVSAKLQEDLPVGLEGQLLLEGEVDGGQLPLLSGDVWITRLRYSKKFKVGRIPVFGGVGPVKSVKTYTHGMDGVRLDISLHGSKNLKLENNVLDVSFAIDESQKSFRVIGTDKRPVIVGTVRVKQGTLTWQNRTFEITRGLVDFSNQNGIEPEFDIVAEGQVRSWLLVLQATGTPEDFKVLVNSSPSLSEEDVLCLMASEMTCEEAREGLGFVGSYGLNTLLGSFKSLDSFGVSSQYNPVTGKSEPVVSFKKKLTERISFAAVSTLFKNQDTGVEQYVKATVAYKVTEHMSVEGTYDSKNLSDGGSLGNMGVDVSWHFEF
jgi:translocation and assembly module TamB